MYTAALFKDKDLCACLDVHVCMFTYTYIYTRVFTYEFIIYVFMYECIIYTCFGIYICSSV